MGLKPFEAELSMAVRRNPPTSGSTAPEVEQDVSEELEAKVKKYLRGDGADLEALKDKKLKGQLSIRENLYGRSAKAAAKAEKWLMPTEAGYLEAEGLEKTWRIKQESIVQEVDVSSSRKVFDIVLPELGPYIIDYTQNGRFMAIGGRKGHLAIINVKNMGLVKELQVKETVRDVIFLHNEFFLAAAQKKYTYIYNGDGTELHCLKEHGPVIKLQFLRNHFLLSSINKFGQLRYQDVTTGQIVANHQTRLGCCRTMQVNPFNNLIGLGHNNGQITMWQPTRGNHVVKMLCHHGSISAVSFHSAGNLMATAGMDRKIKLWDLRKMEVLHTYSGHAKSLEFSQKGLLGIGNGSFVQVWKDEDGDQNYTRYMSHRMVKGYQIGEIMFQPYEDVLGIGHSTGISSILVPGSGEPNFDSWVANPFETSRQRKEKEIHSLLDKLPPETIMWDPKQIGNVRPPQKKEKPSKSEIENEMEAAVEAAKNVTLKRKTKGRNKPSKREGKKKGGIIKAKRPFMQDMVKEEQARKKRKLSESKSELPKSLLRFVRNVD